MSYSANFNFSANTVPAIVVLAGILFMFIHLMNPFGEYFSTLPMGAIGVLLLVMGIILFILVNKK